MTYSVKFCVNSLTLKAKQYAHVVLVRKERTGPLFVIFNRTIKDSLLISVMDSLDDINTAYRLLAKI